MKKIKCNATGCMYNNQKYCESKNENIIPNYKNGITTSGLYYEEIECTTFKSKIIINK